MNAVESQLELLRRHVETIDVPIGPRIESKRPNTNRFAISAPWVFGILIVAAPAFAEIYSKYAAENATAKNLTAGLQKSSGLAMQPDSIVAEGAPKLDGIFRGAGFRTLRSGTYASGSAFVEIANANGSIMVLVQRIVSTGTPFVTVIPPGRTLDFEAKSRFDVLPGRARITTFSATPVSDTDFARIENAAEAFL